MTERRRGKYPWDDWTDGAQWMIYRGEDYAISTYNMQISLHGRAKSQGLKVSSRSFLDRSPDEVGLMTTREGLMFQFYAEQ